jgi:hypothetical protein
VASTESSLFLNSNNKVIWTTNYEKEYQKNYRAEDGITDPKGESANIAGLILNSLKSKKLLIPAGKTIESN